MLERLLVLFPPPSSSAEFFAELASYAENIERASQPEGIGSTNRSEYHKHRLIVVNLMQNLGASQPDNSIVMQSWSHP